MEQRSNGEIRMPIVLPLTRPAALGDRSTHVNTAQWVSISISRRVRDCSPVAGRVANPPVRNRRFAIVRRLANALIAGSILFGGPSVEGTQARRDSWWAAVPPGESDSITHLCRESGDPPAFREVADDRFRTAVESRLRDKDIVPIDSEEAFRLVGPPPDKARWVKAYLVRAVRFHPRRGAFTVDSCGRNLLVGFTADPGSSDQEMVRAALVVELHSPAERVFVTCGVGIR